MKIKLGVGVAVTLIAGLTLAGCSGTSAPSKNSAGKVTGTLTGIYDIGYKTTMNPIIANFEKAYPGVTVKMDYTGNIASVLSTELQAGTAPDLIDDFPGGTPGDTTGLTTIALASLGRLAKIPSSETWTTKIPAVWKAQVSYKGSVYSYPGAVQPLAAIYNQTVMEKLNLTIPTTLKQVYALCTAAKAAGVYAFAQGLGETVAGPQMMSFGQMASLLYGPTPNFPAEITSGKATYQTSPWVDQFKIYQKMYNLGCFGAGSLGRTRQQGAQAVAQGQALAQVDTGGQMGIIQGLAPKADIVVAPIPATNDGKNFITALPGYTMSINAKAKNPVAAQAFLAFLAQPKQSVIYAKGFSSVPIIPNADFKPSANLKGFAALVAAGKFAQLADLGPNTVDIALNTGVQSLLLGKLTPQGVAAGMQTAAKG